MKKVLVGGVFSVLHPGHYFFLKKAKSMGDFLIVVVASDRTVMRKKGFLIKTAEERKSEIEKMGIADRVVIGNSEDKFRVIEKEKPDMIVLGYDQKIDKDIEKRIRDSGMKSEVVKIKEKFKGYSSSIIHKIKNKKGLEPFTK